MRVFTSWDEAKNAYGWVGTEPIARHAKQVFERVPTVGFVVPELYPKERAVIEAAKAWWMFGEWSKEHDDAKIALCKAVEALLAAERGE
jgi:hypothetical protein